MKKCFKYIIFFSLIVVTISLVMGYLSFFHPLFDSFSHFRIHLLTLMIILFFMNILLHQKLFRYIFIFLFILSSGYAFTLLKPYGNRLETQENSINFMQFNLNFRNQHMQTVKEFLLEKNIEIVTFQEVTLQHERFLKGMKAEYPYQKYCKFAGVGGVAILSVYPFIDSEGGCVEGEGLVWGSVLIKSKKVNIASLHLHWPYPYKHHSQISRLKTVFEGMPSPKIIAGDFNAAPWSYAVKRIMNASESEVVAGTRWSLNIGNPNSFLHMQLPIDHVLLSKELEAESIYVGKSLGSDHLPIISQISFK